MLINIKKAGIPAMKRNTPHKIYSIKLTIKY